MYSEYMSCTYVHMTMYDRYGDTSCAGRDAAGFSRIARVARSAVCRVRARWLVARTVARPKMMMRSFLVAGTFAACTMRGSHARSADAETWMGWVGPYHTTNLTVPDGSGRTVWDTFRFGQAALMNAASDGGWGLEDDVAFHCGGGGHDVNGLMGIMVPPTEGGVVNNPNDTALLAPASSQPGLVQGAARFSRLAATRCPQLTGVVIDGASFRENRAVGRARFGVSSLVWHPR